MTPKQRQRILRVAKVLQKVAGPALGPVISANSLVQEMYNAVENSKLHGIEAEDKLRTLALEWLDVQATTVDDLYKKIYKELATGDKQTYLNGRQMLDLLEQDMDGW